MSNCKHDNVYKCVWITNHALRRLGFKFYRLITWKRCWPIHEQRFWRYIKTCFSIINITWNAWRFVCLIVRTLSRRIRRYRGTWGWCWSLQIRVSALEASKPNNNLTHRRSGQRQWFSDNCHGTFTDSDIVRICNCTSNDIERFSDGGTPIQVMEIVLDYASVQAKVAIDHDDSVVIPNAKWRHEEY